MLLNKIRIVLVEPSHPGNIGAAARAIKNMGLSRLYLVRPKSFPNPEAYYRASNADDVLDSAVVVDDLMGAIGDCVTVFGTSARDRVMPQPMLDVRDAGVKTAAETERGEIAIVFGRERTGLENHELMKCHYHIKIPTNPDYCSLNLAAAVQVVTYELRMAMLQSGELESNLPREINELATSEELEGLYDHIQTALIETGFLDPKFPKTIMPRMRQIFSRARLDKDDVNLLRGVLVSIQKNT